MIDRKYLKALREANSFARTESTVIVGVEEFDELCRVYLAYLDAPVDRAGYYSQPPMRAVTGCYFTGPDAASMCGKWYRLVEVKE